MTKRKNSGVFLSLIKLGKKYGIEFFLSFALVSVLFFSVQYHPRIDKLPADIAIILSPHFDDATLSLGGFMADRKNPVIVATVFAGKPSESMRSNWDAISGFKDSDEALTVRNIENIKALDHAGAYPLNLNYSDFQYRHDKTPIATEKLLQSIKKDIDTVLNKFSDSETVSVYGPAEFGSVITHPDHKLLHDAFSEIAREKIGLENVHFFFYEDFPYIARYKASTSTPLKIFLEKESGGISLREIPFPISNIGLTKKIEGIKAYASQDKAFWSLGENIAEKARTFSETRCQKDIPSQNICEVVYEIIK